MALGNQSLASYGCHIFYGKKPHESEFQAGDMGGNRVGQGRALARFSVQQLPNGSALVSQGFLCAVFAVYCIAVSLKPCKRL